ncbi:Flp pilus assembly protein TadD [Polaromonas sp. CF318]|uniref:tetratricopeptide repeat protein n=1 Tax=Polaromonas sp. CF318 TaxID=1144318 RepID=UPI00027135B7|nr:tetratricopeptide repeat protein [Polaromonas sp. CF318]EJL81387.1 Flp pilus assembly protein TadD [Polaromonas sp. CF318]
MRKYTSSGEHATRSRRAAATSALFQAAFSAHQAGRLADAQKAYSQVLLRDERHADASHLLGVVYLQAGKLPEAEKQIRKALAVREDAFALGNLANLLQGRRQLVEAEASYRRALELKPDFADAHYNLGVLLSGTARMAEAEASLRRALEFKPDFANAHYNLGTLLRSSGRLPEAEAAYRQALKFNPDFADAHNDLGVLLRSCERLPEAETAFRHALAVRPDFADAHYNLGLLLQNGKRLSEAEAAYRRSLEFKPDFADAHYHLGLLLQGVGRQTEAELAYRRARELKPDFAEVHHNLGLLLHNGQRLAEAEVAYLRALELKPDFAEVHHNLGLLLHNSQRLVEAEAAYRRALALNPGHAEAHNNLGALLGKYKRLPEAEAAYRRALALNPGHVEAHNNLGALLGKCKRLPEAEAALRRALELNPHHVGAHNNLGVLLYGTHRMPEAETAYRRAIDLSPGHAEACFNLSILLLFSQRYSEAWPLYESRLQLQGINDPDLSFPQWKGESLAGKSLVIWPEQGFGDYIQFVRYASLLKARGVTRLTLLCPRPLQALLETVESVDAVVTDPAQICVHDYWSFSLSLPLHCATTENSIPVAPGPYVHALPDRIARWRDRLPVAPTRKVGLVWKGQPQHKNDANRSLPGLASLAPLWSVPGVAFISLQKGQGEEEAAQPPAGQALVALGAQMTDFADSAAIVSQLDLVICVDTAMAHLAGAMNKPCWVLLPATGTDWRWQLDRLDSPWYPSLRLFRQSDAQDWSATIGEVATALHAWTNAHS